MITDTRNISHPWIIIFKNQPTINHFQSVSHQNYSRNTLPPKIPTTKEINQIPRNPFLTDRLFATYVRIQETQNISQLTDICREPITRQGLIRLRSRLFVTCCRGR